MNQQDLHSSRHLAARYFEMWNTGDTSIASHILHPDWIDHTHPEVTGPHSVREAVARVRAAQPHLRFRIDAVLGDGDLVAVVGIVSRTVGDDGTRLAWLIRTRDGRMVEMWTYRDTNA